MFSTIKSPVFSELAFDLGDHDIARLPVDLAFFETLRELNGIRPIKLVFLLNAVGFPPNSVLQEFGKVLGSVTARGLLDFLDSPPTVMDIRQVRPHHNSRWDVPFPEFD